MMVGSDVVVHGNYVEVNPNSKIAEDVIQIITDAYASELIKAERELAKHLAVPTRCAGAILYGRTRGWWTPAIERKIIKWGRAGEIDRIHRFLYCDC